MIIFSFDFLSCFFGSFHEEYRIIDWKMTIETVGSFLNNQMVAVVTFHGLVILVGLRLKPSLSPLTMI
jgi:hypothetical protein